MLDNLTSRLAKIVKTIRGEARLTEANVQDALREVRIALLEADVALPVVKHFIDAVRAGDPSKLTCEIEEGHLSTTLPHIANIAYRLHRELRFDGKTETFTGDADANALLTRQYRAPFIVPDKV